MSATQLISFIMSSFSLSHLSSPPNRSSSNSTLSWDFLFSPIEEPQPQMYSISGYNTAYVLCICFQGLALLILTFINSERGRKAQQKTKEE